MKDIRTTDFPPQEINERLVVIWLLFMEIEL